MFMRNYCPESQYLFVTIQLASGAQVDIIYSNHTSSGQRTHRDRHNICSQSRASEGCAVTLRLSKALSGGLPLNICLYSSTDCSMWISVLAMDPYSDRSSHNYPVLWQTLYSHCRWYNTQNMIAYWWKSEGAMSAADKNRRHLFTAVRAPAKEDFIEQSYIRCSQMDNHMLLLSRLYI